jgi:hypothetical protein
MVDDAEPEQQQQVRLLMHRVLRRTQSSHSLCLDHTQWPDNTHCSDRHICLAPVPMHPQVQRLWR